MATPKQNKNGTWSIRVYAYTDETGKPVQKQFTANKKSDVLAKARAFEAERARLSKNDLTVAESVERYISSRESALSPATIRAYRINARCHFDKIGMIRVNALGTVYVNEEFSKLMHAGSVIVDISSNSAYILPGFLASKKTFALADVNEDKFIKKILSLPNKLKGYKASGLAYGLSKKFVIWYAAKSAFKLGEKGIRVCSLSPGLIATDMGNLEAEEGGALLKTTAEKRMGTPEELGFAIASIADERNGYLSGVDVLVDGGSVIGKAFVK